MSINFSQENKLAIADALASVGVTNEDSQNKWIDHAANTATATAFGAGSLLTYTHLQTSDGTAKESFSERFPSISDPNSLTKITPAVLEGYKPDMVCFDTHYRGTKEAPAITLGIEKSEGAELSGGILETSLEGMSPDMATNFLIYYLEEFKDREFPPDMPIYAFDVVEAGGVPVLGCLADTTGPLYIHNENNDYAQKDSAYFFEKGDVVAIAHNIASAHGPTHDPSTGAEKPLGKITPLDFLRDLVDSSIERDIPVDKGIMNLYVASVEERQNLPAGQRMALEKFEVEERHARTPDLLNDFGNVVYLHNTKFTPDVDAANDAEFNDLDYG